jgi:hypothetical protein
MLQAFGEHRIGRQITFEGLSPSAAIPKHGVPVGVDYVVLD